MPIKVFENSISKIISLLIVFNSGNALERGVDIELITSVKRDIPVYAKFKNTWLTK